MLLEIKNLFFAYDAEKPLFQNFNLRIENGDVIALAGESGCGKSTLLSLIYGLKEWQSGEIIFDGKQLLGPKGNLVPGEKDMKFVAQNYDLMPYSMVYDNVGKFISNINLNQKREIVLELLRVVGLEDFADVKPQFLSGGQQQRVALARALSVMPKLLLLDEPFSNLDFSRKVALRENLFDYVRRHNISLIISTHDLQEVLPWLDRIVVLQNGRLIQNDSAEEIYKNPYNAYVAKLFGEVNVFSDEEKAQFGLSKKFWFPNEIKISETGEMAQVQESRFAGSHYWNRLTLNGKNIIVYSEEKLSDEITVRFTAR